MSRDTSKLFVELLEAQYETEKIKMIIRKAYKRSYGEYHEDTAIVVSEDSYKQIRKWLGED